MVVIEFQRTKQIRQNHEPLETFMKQEIVFICIYFQFPYLPPFYTNWLEGLPTLKNKLSPSMYKVHYEVSQCGGILNYFYEVYLIHHAQVHGYRVVHTIIQVSLCEILEFRGLFINNRAKHVVKYCWSVHALLNRITRCDSSNSKRRYYCVLW